MNFYRIRLNIFLLAGGLMCFMACKKDEETNISSSSNPVVNDEPVVSTSGLLPITERVIPITDLSSGITITGATKKTGTLPPPTSSLSLNTDLNSKKITLKDGLDIKFSFTNKVTGAYIQFKDANGNNVDGYFDVPINSTTPNLKKLPGGTIHAELGTDLYPGRFCYEICFYDDNNVYQPYIVCEVIKPPSADSLLFGKWVNDTILEQSLLPIYTTKQIKIICDDNSLLYVLDKLGVKNKKTIEFKDDGTYAEFVISEYSLLDSVKTKEHCAAVYNSEKIQEIEIIEGYYKTTPDDYAVNSGGATRYKGGVEFTVEKYSNSIYPEKNKKNYNSPSSAVSLNTNNNADVGFVYNDSFDKSSKNLRFLERSDVSFNVPYVIEK